MGQPVGRRVGRLINSTGRPLLCPSVKGLAANVNGGAASGQQIRNIFLLGRVGMVCLTVAHQLKKLTDRAGLRPGL